MNALYVLEALDAKTAELKAMWVPDYEKQAILMMKEAFKEYDK